MNSDHDASASLWNIPMIASLLSAAKISGKSKTILCPLLDFPKYSMNSAKMKGLANYKTLDEQLKTCLPLEQFLAKEIVHFDHP